MAAWLVLFLAGVCVGLLLAWLIDATRPTLAVADDYETALRHEVALIRRERNKGMMPAPESARGIPPFDVP